MTTDSETMEQYLNFVQTRFLISVLVFVSRDYELGRVSDFGGVDHQSRTRLIFRSTPKSRPNNLYMGLRCPSVRPQKVFPIPMKFGM